VPRWEDDGRGRLERAALGLFTERGYDATTVAQIADRAGLTERSFYRHYRDKREVLFAGADLEACLRAAVEDAPAGRGPLEVLVTALGSAGQVLRSKEFLRDRAVVVAANPPLQERELVKLASMSAALAAAVTGRGVDPRTAQLATDIALGILRAAVERWLTDTGDGPFGDHIPAVTREVRAITTATSEVPVTAPNSH